MLLWLMCQAARAQNRDLHPECAAQAMGLN